MSVMKAGKAVDKPSLHSLTLAIGPVFADRIARLFCEAIAHNRWAKTRGLKIQVLRIAYRELTMSDDSSTVFRHADGRLMRRRSAACPISCRATAAVTNAVLNGDVTPHEGAAAARA
jgi:hypothetical protein